MRATVLLLALLTAASCQKLTLDDDDDVPDGYATQSVPTTSGKGTETAPYTPAQIRDKARSGEAWVVGYVVGSTKNAMGAATYVVPTENKTNLLLARDSTCRDHTLCVPVELNSALQSQISLYAQPALLHQCVMLHGTCDDYYFVHGLRKADAYRLLPDFDLHDIDPSPEEWSGAQYGF